MVFCHCPCKSVADTGRPTVYIMYTFSLLRKARSWVQAMNIMMFMGRKLTQNKINLTANKHLPLPIRSL